MSNITINGKKLEGDFFDADFMDRYEGATRKMYDVAMAEKGKHYEKIADAFRAQCRIIEDYFNEIFGADASDQIFGSAYNLKEHLEAVAELTNVAANAKKDVNDLVNKYTQRQQSYQRPYQGTGKKKR
jgi:hypothetical protein